MRPGDRRWIEIKMPTARRTAGIMPPRCPGTRPGAWTTRIPSGGAARVPHAARLRSIPCPRVERPRATATDKLRQCRNTYGPEERDHCTGRQLLSARFRQAAQGEARMPTAVTQMVPHIVPCLQTRGRHSFSFGTSQCGHAGVPVQAQEHDQDGEGRPATRRPPSHHSWRCGSPRPRPQLCSGGGS